MKHSSKLRSLMLLSMLALFLPLFAQDDKQKDTFDWNPVMDAIIQIETCRIWKMGIRYTIKGSQQFVNRVRSVMKQQAKQKAKSEE